MLAYHEGGSMDEAAKFDLEKRIDLYKFYVDLYAKGIVIFLAIQSFVLKSAIDIPRHRQALATVGATAAIIFLVPLFFSFVHERHLRSEFLRLATATETTIVTTAPLRALIWAVAAFWILIFCACLFVYRMPSN